MPPVGPLRVRRPKSCSAMQSRAKPLRFSRNSEQIMTQEVWTAVDSYFSELFIPADPALDAALAASDAAHLPPMQVAQNKGKLLYLLALIQRAKTILDIGTL